MGKHALPIETEADYELPWGEPKVPMSLPLHSNLSHA